MLGKYTATTERYTLSLHDALPIYSEGTARKQMRHAGRPEWQFKETTKQVFDKYINFLKTKNVAWLNNAERDS